jgi:hypothetical protein
MGRIRNVANLRTSALYRFSELPRHLLSASISSSSLHVEPTQTKEDPALIDKHFVTVSYETCLLDVAHSNADPILVLEFLVISEIDTVRVQTRQINVHDLRMFVSHVFRKAVSSEGDELIFDFLWKMYRKRELVVNERRCQKL